MKKRLQKCLHVTLVCTIVSLLSIDSASACRLIGCRRGACCSCCPRTCGCDLPAPAENAPSSEAQPKSIPSPSDRPAAVSPAPAQSQRALQPRQSIPHVQVEPAARPNEIDAVAPTQPTSE